MYYHGTEIHTKRREKMQVKQRIIQSGNQIELMDFKNPLSINENTVLNPNGRNGNPELHSEEEYQIIKEDNRKKTLQRNIVRLWRLYHSNKGKYKHRDKFITLTFRELPDCINTADLELNKFIKRLKKFARSKIEYIGTRELQKENDRNGIHYHIILFGCPFIAHHELLKLWCIHNPYMDINNPSGVNIKAIKDGLGDMTNYLTSYQVKELLEDDFIQGHKTLIQSRHLIQPIITDYEAIAYIPGIEDIKKGLSFLDNKITYYRIEQ